jgi:hypothetical protein
VHQDGTPFVWIGDTIWRWQHLSPPEQEEYLDWRKRQGFTVIQTRLAGNDQPIDDSVGGELSFEGGRITRPNPRYWSHVDRWLERIADRGMYAAVVLMWGQPRDIASSTATELYAYARWAGHRYRDLDHVVWMTLGEGTHPGSPREKILAAVDGLREGDEGHKLLTIHANNLTGTSQRFHNQVDFNTWQTSQFCSPTRLPNYTGDWRADDVTGNWRVWEAIAHDFSREPTKPTLDAEAWYEGPRYGSGFADRFPCQACHVRRRAYFTVFAGAFGHTYGAEGLWDARTDECPTWREALAFPGGDQMRHLKSLLQSKPILTRVPDQALIADGQSDSYEGHVQATRAIDGSYAWLYIAGGHNVAVDLPRLPVSKIQARWFDPRNGGYTTIGEFDNSRRRWFDPPGEPGIGNDYVLVLEAQSP